MVRQKHRRVHQSHNSQGHIPVRTSLHGLQQIAKALEASGVTYAATGLAASWLYAPYASFRLITVYVDRLPDDEVLASFGYREVDAGANVWLVEPNDDEVFEQRKRLHDIWCASALQVYLDLQSHPERSSEAADTLRRQCLKFWVSLASIGHLLDVLGATSNCPSRKSQSAMFQVEHGRFHFPFKSKMSWRVPFGALLIYGYYPK